MKVTYRQRTFIDDYRCIDSERTINAVNAFRSGSILYCYIDRFNVLAISLDDIIDIEKE